MKNFLIYIFTTFALFNNWSFSKLNAKENSVNSENIVSIAYENNSLEIYPEEISKFKIIVDIEKNWHIYSFDKNQNIEGVQTKITPILPKEFSIKMQEPLNAVKFENMGLVSYGYKDKLNLVFFLKTPKDIDNLKDKNIKLKLSYTACNATCLQGEKDLIISLSPLSKLSEKNANYFKQNKLEYEHLFLNGDKNVNIATSQTKEKTSLIKYLLFAFLGGIILNLMPCVLPVIGLKIISLISSANENKLLIIKHSLVYCIGVVLSFSLIGLAIFSMRFFGENAGWATQFSNPWIVGFLCILMFIIALNFAGLFEVGSSIGTKATKVKGSGVTGSFLTGILAVVVASPCTAPFMGVSIGYAFLSNNIYLALLIFIFLGLGMAFPYLILSLFPNLLKFIPKPGIWMVYLKKSFSILLFLSSCWLLGILSSLLNIEKYFIFILIIPICLYILLYIYGKKQMGKIDLSTKILCLIGILLIAIYASFNIFYKTKTENFEYQKYSPELVKSLQDKSIAVFVDFTATWCITCKANKIALSSKEVQLAIKEKNIAILVADYTHHDPQITNVLQSFGRIGVPFYILYNKNKNVIILPEILTKQILLKYIDEI